MAVLEVQGICKTFDKNTVVLRGIDFSLEKGDFAVICGATGSGKSTVVNLLPRLYDVSEGTVFLDGKDVRSYPLKELRKKIGSALQRPAIFKGTIRSNVLPLGEADEERLSSAVDTAQARDVVNAKENGYDSVLEQNGRNLSGGQKQRLSIARAIAKKPRIYLFDDSFSALDYKTDVALRRALKAQTDNATVIIVAQRISTVLHANRILVLDEGRIVGDGTHAQLMESCPEYQEIARSQLSQKELNLSKEGE